jgi:hypothetical protein
MKIIGLVLFTLVFLNGPVWGEEPMSDFDRFYCEEVGYKKECILYRASIMNLITTPERFHGKRVRVHGYLSIGFEESILFHTKDSTHVEAVWFSIGDRPIETEADADAYQKKKKEVMAKFNNRRVLVEGEFDMKVNSRLVYRGAIKNITRIEQRGPKVK